MNFQVQDAAASVIYLRLKALAYHIPSITYSNCRFGFVIASHYCVMKCCSNGRFGIASCNSLLRDEILQQRPVNLFL